MPSESPTKIRPSPFDALVAAAAALGPVPIAIVHPCDALSLEGALEAAKSGLIDGIESPVMPTSWLRRT